MKGQGCPARMGQKGAAAHFCTKLWRNPVEWRIQPCWVLQATGLDSSQTGQLSFRKPNRGPDPQIMWLSFLSLERLWAKAGGRFCIGGGAIPPSVEKRPILHACPDFSPFSGYFRKRVFSILRIRIEIHACGPSIPAAKMVGLGEFPHPGTRV